MEKEELDLSLQLIVLIIKLIESRLYFLMQRVKEIYIT